MTLSIWDGVGQTFSVGFFSLGAKIGREESGFIPDVNTYAGGSRAAEEDLSLYVIRRRGFGENTPPKIL
jgi:hypothetical protein